MPTPNALAQNTTQSPPRPTHPNDILIDGITTNPQFLLAGLLLFTIFLLRVFTGSTQGTLATAHMGGATERNAAKQAALKQIADRAADQQPFPAALTVGPPGHPKTIHFPTAGPVTSILGASGKGKSFSLIVPMLMSVIEQGFPLILFDYKYPDLARTIAPYAKFFGYDIHPFCPGRRESQALNLCEMIKNSQDTSTAQEATGVMTANNQEMANTKGSDPFFDRAGSSLLAGGMCAVKDTEYPDLLTVQQFLSLTDLPKRIEAAKSMNPWLKQTFSQYLKSAKSPKTIGSIETTAEGMLSQFLTESFVTSLIGKSTIPFKLTGKQMIIVGMDKLRGKAISPVLATTIHMLIQYNFAQERTRPLVLAMDELNALHLKGLMGWANRLRSEGFICLAGIQNLGETNAVYGESQTESILSASANKAVFNPQELKTAKMISDYCGNLQIRDKSKSHGWSQGGSNRGEQSRNTTKPLIETSELLRMDVGEILNICPEQKNKHYACVPIKQRVELQPETTDAIAECNNAWDTHMYKALVESAPTYSQPSFNKRQKALRQLFPDPL